MGCIAPGCPSPATVGALFCEKHILSPTGQRGGWLSAHKRKQSIVQNPTERLDASNIAPRLWMGGKPPFDKDLPKIDMLVLAARELQPQQVAFHGSVYRCPLVDDYLELDDIGRALMCAHTVATMLLAKKSVLVTCSAGKNRSGLITGLALGYIVPRMTSDDIIRLIRLRRGIPGVLANPAFLGYLKKYIDGKKPPPPAKT